MKKTVVRVIIAVIALFLVGLLVIGAILGSVIAGLPASQGARLEIDGHTVGIETGGSYAWIVRTETGALLVDSGMDGTASALLAELTAMGLSADDVHTVLLTHAHADHTSGLGNFPRATLVHGPGEGPLLRGEGAKVGWLAGIVGRLNGPATLPAEVVEASDGQILDVDGLSVKVLSTPGHTMGSATYVLGDLVFSGDTLVSNGTGVQTLPGAVTSDAGALATSVRRFGPLDAVWMADGHGGITPNADDAIEAWLAEQP